jgi:hypothetical protein
VSAHTVVLTGAAALVAGAFSMGAGEYISVTNQNELVHAEVALERKVLARFPPSVMSWRGISAATAPIRPPRPGWLRRCPGTRARRCGCMLARNWA